MKFRILLATLFIGVFLVPISKAQKLSKVKKLVIASVDSHEVDLIKLSDEIWANAETALKEYKFSKLHADYAEAQGYKLERGVAGYADGIYRQLWFRETNYWGVERI